MLFLSQRRNAYANMAYVYICERKKKEIKYEIW